MVITGITDQRFFFTFLSPKSAFTVHTRNMSWDLSHDVPGQVPEHFSITACVVAFSSCTDITDGIPCIVEFHCKLGNRAISVTLHIG